MRAFALTAAVLLAGSGLSLAGTGEPATGEGSLLAQGTTGLQPVAGGPPGPRADPAATPEPPPKDDDARVALVIGDSLATALGQGLDIAFADTPGLRIAVAANGASGLVRDDYFDWPAEVTDIVAGGDAPDALVVMLGINDNQDMTVGGTTLPRSGEAWEDAYRDRIGVLVEAARRENITVFWVGLAPMADTALSQAAAQEDELFRQEVPAAGGVFIDIWDAFAAPDGGYAQRGPTIEGQDARLRLDDGIHFTEAGARKIAFFLEDDMRLWLRTGAAPASAGTAAPPITATVPEALPGVLQIAGPVLSLTDPQQPDATELAGDAPVLLDPTSPLYRLLVLGEPVPTTPGRADDFRWPRE